ncbi:TonB-dependent receptor [Desertivirga arenae]|uniref:TonB-dependent receptor n=1 Tax=Desertivirga arenae TaxID=2810309 RepID=UPI001A97A73F|nr:TonB-dependent receptor [Pedobacter sp. SYSU D00823]
MKKNHYGASYAPCNVYLKILLMLKCTLLLVLISAYNAFSVGYSQTRINLNVNNVSLRKALKEIEKTSSFRFLYNEDIFRGSRAKSLEVRNASLDEVMKLLLENTSLNYQQNENNLVIISASELSNAAFTVSGTVTDEKGQTLPGVSVRVKGASTGVTSDINGRFSISVPDENAVLVFSYIGFTSTELPVNGQKNLSVVLKPSSTSLNEVVVVGYGTQKKANLTGAVASVSGEELVKRPVTNPAAMLQGTMSGVQITQGTGEPGNENVSIRIRGTGTFSGAGADPLVLIDGVQGNFSDLNPNDIENVSVLKDAASASIYGARAANGVIVVTTKKGKEGKLSIQYSGNYGLYTPTKLFDLVTNSAEYMELYNEARINTGLTDPNGLYSQAQIDQYRNATDRTQYPNTDWLDLIFQTAPTQNHNLTFTGGKAGTTYNASLGYVDQEGIMKGFDYKKYNARLNLSSQINPKIKFGTNILLKFGRRNAPVFGSEDMFLSAMSQAPTYSPYTTDGSGHFTYKAYDFEYNNKNPIALLDGNINHDTDDYAANAQGWFEAELLKGLTWYTKGAVNANFDKYKDFRPPLQLYNFRTNALMSTLDLGGGLRVQDQQTVYTNLFTYLNYDRTFGSHGLKLQGGFSNEKNTYQYLQGYRRNYSTDLLRELNAGSESVQSTNGTQNSWALMSFFGRLNYSFKDRYLFEANLRHDGSSRLNPGSRWRTFPSFSAGWRVTEENFLKDLRLSWLNNFKIRGSYGKLGNQNIDLYPYQDILNFTGNYSFDNSSLTTGVAQTRLSNVNITWETTTMSDLGLDLTLFGGLDITADWYKKRTTDILRASQVTALVGLEPPTINNGTLDNTGVELGINYRRSVKDGALGGLNYSLGFNLEHYKNKLVEFGQPEINGYRINQNGGEWNAYYMLEQIGIFQSAQEVQNSPKQFGDDTVPGDLKFKDQNGDGVVNNDDRIIMKGNYPGFNYSFNLSANWKGFDLSAMMQGVENIKFFVSDWGTVPFVQGSPPTTNWRERWTPENPSSTMPRLYWGWSAPEKIRRASSYYLQDASYLRLKNLTLGYSLPQKLNKKFGADQVRIFFSGDNLFTSTKYPGLDPERGGSGSFVQYPQNKIYAFGINVRF